MPLAAEPAYPKEDAGGGYDLTNLTNVSREIDTSSSYDPTVFLLHQEEEDNTTADDTVDDVGI